MANNGSLIDEIVNSALGYVSLTSPVAISLAEGAKDYLWRGADKSLRILSNLTNSSYESIRSLGKMSGLIFKNNLFFL